MTLETLTTLFGWMAVLNIALLLFATVMVVVMQDFIAGLHHRLFDMPEQDVKKAYFAWLAQYKIMTLVLTVIPYIALRLI